MQDLLILWDAIFADDVMFDLVDYVFVAMLVYLRNAREFAVLRSCAVFFWSNFHSIPKWTSSLLRASLVKAVQLLLCRHCHPFSVESA